MKYVKTFEEFLKILQQHQTDTGTRYVYGYGPKYFSEAEIKFSETTKIHWQGNVPYYHFGTRKYVCHQGKDTNTYKKEKYAKERNEKILSGVEVKQCKHFQETKKVGCPAAVKVTRIFRLNYKLPGLVMKKKKAQFSFNLKDNISKGERIVGRELYMFTLPKPEEHKFHPTAKSEEDSPQESVAAVKMEQDGSCGAVAEEGDSITETSSTILAEGQSAGDVGEDPLGQSDESNGPEPIEEVVIQCAVKSMESPERPSVDEDGADQWEYILPNEDALEAITDETDSAENSSCEKMELIGQCHSSLMFIQSRLCLLEARDLRQISGSLAETADYVAQRT